MTGVAKSSDVIVVGLGAMGAAALCQLARRGVRALGIDRYHPPHDHGSSHGDTRITRLALGEGAQYLPLARRSHEIWRELESATGETLLREAGGLVFSSLQGRTAAHGAADFLRTTIDVAQQNDISHEVLDAAALARRFPQFRFESDETGILEHSAGYVRPERCIAAQLRVAGELGAQVRTGERVVNWSADGGGVCVGTDRGAYRADRLILTAGSWAMELMPGLSEAVRVFRQVLFWFDTDGPEELFRDDRMPVFIRVPDARAPMFYGFPAVDESGGGLKIATEQFEQTCAPDGVERTVSPAEVAAMHALVSPHVRVTGRVVRTAVCKYTVTPDFHFVIDRHPRSERVWFASPCSGHGFKHSAAIGEALAQQVLDGRSCCDLGPFSLERLARRGW
jgi:sarcosine oxidase